MKQFVSTINGNPLIGSNEVVFIMRWITKQEMKDSCRRLFDPTTDLSDVNCCVSMECQDQCYQPLQFP